ncbi:hypothetical protein HMI56_006859 [Coelomomyces lativittatus]|nr:hypothetical protein HMI56_006859 [Coelomomyces lativittatus]
MQSHNKNCKLKLDSTFPQGAVTLVTCFPHVLIQILSLPESDRLKLSGALQTHLNECKHQRLLDSSKSFDASSSTSTSSTSSSSSSSSSSATTSTLLSLQSRPKKKLHTHFPTKDPRDPNVSHLSRRPFMGQLVPTDLKYKPESVKSHSIELQEKSKTWKENGFIRMHR